MTTAKPLPSQAELQDLLDYDPETGALTWRSRKPPHRGNPKHAGKVAGFRHNKYWVVTINGTDCKAHRIAWVITHGRLDQDQIIDHINGDRYDNRMANLRLASFVQNLGNTGIRKNNRCGLKGAFFHAKSGKWAASIKVGNKSVHLGLHASPEDAHAAYMVAAKKHFGKFARAA